jgi:hypothetical protein
MTAVAARPAVVIRLAPEFRRIGVYLLFGYAAAMALVVWLKRAGLNPTEWWEITLVGALLGAPTLALLALVWRYRIVVDEAGVWRRRFFRWDLWPWEAFARGKIQSGGDRTCFVCPAKPWWWRHLVPAFVTEADREALIARIHHVWAPPPPPAPPREVTVRLGLSRWAVLSRHGVRVGRGGRDGGRSYTWSQLGPVRLERPDHGHPGFKLLELPLPDRPRPLRLDARRGNRNWSGADAEPIARLVETAVPPDRLEVTATVGPPRTLAEADRRLAELDRRDRELRRGTWLILALLGAVTAWFVYEASGVLRKHPPAGDWTWWFAAGVLLVLPLILVVPCWAALALTRGAVRVSREKLMRWRAEVA